MLFVRFLFQNKNSIKTGLLPGRNRASLAFGKVVSARAPASLRPPRELTPEDSPPLPELQPGCSL